MFEYFPNNYTWSLAVMSALNRGGQISEVDEACRPLKEIAGVKALQEIRRSSARGSRAG
ncbi:MAG: hypothetical protein ACXW2I_09840 [Burkholderiales bacterium]